MNVQDKILQAKQTDIVGFLLGQGYKVKRVGSEHQWDSGHGKVSIKGCLWFDHYEGVGGDAINFVRKYFDKIYLFEAPIDMLSYISMHTGNWQQHSYVAACGTSPKPLLQCMQDFPYINEINICFDNDQAGQKAARKISNELFLKGYQSTILIPKNKDWNEDLLFMRKEGKCQEH